MFAFKTTVHAYLVLLCGLIASCDASVKVDGFEDPAKMAAADEEQFALSIGSSSISWTNPFGAQDFEVIVASDKDCKVAVQTYSKVNETKQALTDLPEGHFHVCVTALVDGKAVRASNNGVLITIDRTAPVIQGPSESVCLKNQRLGIQVTDLTQITYRWERVEGTNDIQFEDPGVMDPSINIAASGNFRIKVTAQDSAGNESSKDILIKCSLKLPVHAATSMSLTDTDTDGGQLGGTLHITHASDESDITQYVVYFGFNATTKASATPLTELNKTGAPLTYNIPLNTVIPAGTTHLLVYTKNNDGEMATPLAMVLVDKGVPEHAAVSLSFTDTDVDAGQVAGTVTITKASSESDITHYLLYWGDSATTKATSTPIATIAKTGANITYTFGANTAIYIGANHLLVYTVNADGEMATGTSVPIVDLGAPAHAAISMAFTDTDLDGGQIAGTLSVTAAADESDLTHYVLYWGSNSTTKASATPIATIAKTGVNFNHTIAANTTVYTGATHLLLFTKNADGEMLTGINVAIVDKGVPTNAAVSMAFTDTDLDGGELAGSIQITKAADESDISDYVLYWGSNTTTKASATPIATIPKTGVNITYNLSANTAVLAGATHFLVYTKNADGEMGTGINVAIVDKGVPVNAAVSMAITDTDLDGGQLAGTLTITKAADESDITHYVLYWGSNASTKASGTEIASIAKTGVNLTHTFNANTAIFAGATHLLVYTKNADGEMGTGVSVAIVDKGVPVNAAVSMSFTDTDLDGGQLAGTVNITKAGDESDIAHYVLYWGSNATTKASGTEIASIAKTGVNLTYTFNANTAILAGATHLLVYTKNADGEMGTGVSVAIVDKGVPVNAAASMSFTDNDLDGGQISGTVNITKATDESDISDYVLYWGSNATTKASASAITTIAKTGSDVSYNFGANTAIYSGATHLLVFTKNADGEMATGINVAIVDKGVPVNAAVSMSFTDNDLDGGQISGTVNITKAGDESDITHYVLYWGSNATTKASGTEIASIAKTGVNLTYTFNANTAIFAGATHLLVFTKNADGEMATGVSVAIVDKGVPVNAAVSMSFTDSDLDGGQIEGTVNISKAGDESDITDYVLYWGSNTTTKASATPIATIAATGFNVTHIFNANTAIFAGATHLLVFTKNADGEMASGINVAIVDKGVPVNAAVGMSFTDTDLDGGQLAGTVNITKAGNESDITHYVLYWGSNATTKASGTEIASIAKTGVNLTYTFNANTAIFAGATHLLVFTKNADGEMATGVNVAIVDKGVPVHAAASVSFTDTDTNSGKLGGTITITKAADESDITHYVIYWSADGTTKLNGTPITTIAATGSDLNHNVGAGTSIPATATAFLVITKNADGEMATGTAHAFTDAGAPVHKAVALYYSDTDADVGQISGTLTIVKATDESDITHYVLYWGSNTTTKQNGTPIATIAKTGANLSYSIGADTAIPAGANNLLVYTKNGSYEMATGTAGLIKDNKRLYGAVLTASSAYFAETPDKAYDSNVGTQWQSANASPSWIEFDLLGSSVVLNRVRLLNNFDNANGTTVTVTVKAGNTTNPGTTAHTFVETRNDGLPYNPNGQWFDAIFGAVAGTSYVRIHTSTTGASWTKYKEIELYEQ